MRAQAIVALLVLTSACDAGRLAVPPGDTFEPNVISLRAGELGDSAPVAHGLAVATPMLLRTARVSLEVDSLDAAIGAVREAVARVGGYAAGFDRNAAASWRPQATLRLRVPVQHLDATVATLTALGRVEAVQLAAQDVGEEFVDVSTRLENARRLERRLLDLLSGRTGKLSDVLQVEEALARVREEAERIEGRRRYLETRAAMSVIELTLHEAGVPARPPVWSAAGDAFGQAWRNFMGLVSLTIAASGVFVPLGLLAAPAWFVMRRARRRPADGPGATA
jgi:hypothetical protein